MFFLLSILPVAASAAVPPFQFFLQARDTAQGLLPMPGGAIGVFGSANVPCVLFEPGACDQTQIPLLAVANAQFSNSSLGSGNSSIAAAAIDANGNIWIAGETDSDDFPLVHPLYTQKIPYKLTAFAARLDPQLNILFSTFLGGQPESGLTSATGVAVDSSGNAYVVGSTVDSGFPATAPVFGIGTPSNAVNPAQYAFIAKISSTGTLIYSRLLGGDGNPCAGPNSCTGYGVYTRPNAIAVDAAGNLTVAGGTNATNFPVTPNVYQTGGGSFITRISADGSTLLWSTEIGAVGPTPVHPGYSSATGMVLDASGNVYLAGTGYAAIAATPGALETTLPPGSGPYVTSVGYAAGISSDATKLIFATNLGTPTNLVGLALDPAGNVWIAGFTESSVFPGLTSTPPGGIDFAIEINANATALQQSLFLVPGTVSIPPVFDSTGALLLSGSAGTLLRLNSANISSTPTVLAVTNSAIPAAQSGVAPGELVTIYGVGLGPATGIAGAPDASGHFPTQLGGVSVQFDSPYRLSAPLLYVGPYQINLQVPFGLAPGPASMMTVTTPGGVLPAIYVPHVGSPGVFGVLNQDSTLNSPENPAAPGSIVSLYLTGLGTPSVPPPPDGAVSTSALNAFVNSVEVTASTRPLPLVVPYAGTAPGSINGLDQINVQLAPGLQNPSLTVSVTTPSAATSNAVTVYTQ